MGTTERKIHLILGIIPKALAIDNINGRKKELKE